MSVAWERIEGFRSPGEYASFERWLDGVLEEDDVEEVEVGERYGSPYFEERWVRHVPSGETWRVVAPDPPFMGLFAPVEDDRADPSG